MDPPLRRALLLALNSQRAMSRDAICRLGRSVELWAGGELPVTGTQAAALGVAPHNLAAAVALIDRAPRRAASLLAEAAARGLTVLFSGDAEYPRALQDLELPPPVLYCRGRLPDRPAIAIVGSRAADPYGLEATALFAAALAGAGLTVVSGFARGIDAAAHRAATRDPSGRTVAVLGCGLDVDYPRGSARLRRHVERQGAILSEFPPGTPALAPHFPIRNRIIAALGFACLVVQAAPRSGSLITARYAVELGRDLWVVPGRIFDRRSAGANCLIRDGASPALAPEQILESLPLEVKDTLRRVADAGAADSGGAARISAGSSGATGAANATTIASGLAERLLAILETGDPTSAEALAQRSGASIDRVLAALLDLEITGRVARVAGPRFVKRAAAWGAPIIRT
ncbi:MAG TPA: DNA-processing protein DprA [Thermoanaerobaculia bacterium]|nr:DNA-processing protein DprA [Thermoanaerobaculia bacterium]